MSMKLKKSQIIMGIPFLLLLLQYAIINNTNGILLVLMNYMDEFVALYFAVYILFYFFRGGKLLKSEKIFLYIMSGILLSGFLSSFFNGVQPIIPTLIDAFTCVKFLIVLVGMSVWLRKKHISFNLIYLNTIIRIVIFVLFVLLIVNTFIIEIFPPMLDRSFWFFKSQRLVFAHSAELAEMALFCLVILFYNDKKKNNLPYMIMASLLVIVSLRIKEIAIVLLFWIMYLYFIRLKIKSKTVLYVLCIVAVVIFGYDQFAYYYGNQETARSLLTLTGIKIANDYFPLGAGFASYASAMSREFYSPLYLKYNLNTVWGLGGANNFNFISDTFWPNVIGELGWIGFIIMFWLFVYLIRMALKMKEDKYCYIGCLAIVGFLVVVSLGASSIYNPFGILCAGLIAYFEHEVKKIRR